MGEEEVRMTEYDGDGGEEDRIFEWEEGLPSADDLTPLSQLLISPELASAFRITPEPFRSMLDVNRASKNTLSSLRDGGGGGEGHLPALSAVENDLIPECSDSRKVRKIIIEDEVVPTGIEDADSATPDWVDDSSGANKTLKRPRLVWTPQLHKRFVDVVAHLGIQNAVPKTIMQLMNVEGLSRENVASHLQKYRLYLKRMQDESGPGPGPSSSDHLFSSTPPVPQSLQQQSDGHRQQHNSSNGHLGMPIHMPYPPPQMVPMPMIGMAAHGGHGHGGAATGGFHGYNMSQQRDWSGNKFGSVVPYHHVARKDK